MNPRNRLQAGSDICSPLCMASSRHSPDTWIAAGRTALALVGAAGLRAETLARQIGTTKGSFYWHFKDVSAFHGAVLQDWAQAYSARFLNESDAIDSPVRQLRTLAGFSLTAEDKAVRAWATHSELAAKHVTRVDHQMDAHIATLLSDIGATHPDFPCLIRAALLTAEAGSGQALTLVDLLLALK